MKSQTIELNKTELHLLNTFIGSYQDDENTGQETQYGIYYETIMEEEEKINTGTKITYLKRAITDPPLLFALWLDRIIAPGYSFKNNKDPALEIIRAFSMINSLYFDKTKLESTFSNIGSHDFSKEETIKAFQKVIRSKINLLIEDLFDKKVEEKIELVKKKIEKEKRECLKGEECLTIRNRGWREILDLPESLQIRGNDTQAIEELGEEYLSLPLSLRNILASDLKGSKFLIYEIGLKIRTIRILYEIFKEKEKFKTTTSSFIENIITIEIKNLKSIASNLTVFKGVLKLTNEIIKKITKIMKLVESIAKSAESPGELVGLSIPSEITSKILLNMTEIKNKASEIELNIYGNNTINSLISEGVKFYELTYLDDQCFEFLRNNLAAITALLRTDTITFDKIITLQENHHCKYIFKNPRVTSDLIRKGVLFDEILGREKLTFFIYFDKSEGEINFLSNEKNIRFKLLSINRILSVYKVKKKFSGDKAAELLSEKNLTSSEIIKLDTTIEEKEKEIYLLADLGIEFHELIYFLIRCKSRKLFFENYGKIKLILKEGVRFSSFLELDKADLSSLIDSYSYYKIHNKKGNIYKSIASGDSFNKIITLDKRKPLHQAILSDCFYIPLFFINNEKFTLPEIFKLKDPARITLFKNHEIVRSLMGAQIKFPESLSVDFLLPILNKYIELKEIISLPDVPRKDTIKTLTLIFIKSGVLFDECSERKEYTSPPAINKSKNEISYLFDKRIVFTVPSINQLLPLFKDGVNFFEDQAIEILSKKSSTLSEIIKLDATIKENEETIYSLITFGAKFHDLVYLFVFYKAKGLFFENYDTIKLILEDGIDFSIFLELDKASLLSLIDSYCNYEIRNKKERIYALADTDDPFDKIVTINPKKPPHWLILSNYFLIPYFFILNKKIKLTEIFKLERPVRTTLFNRRLEVRALMGIGVKFSEISNLHTLPLILDKYYELILVLLKNNIKFSTITKAFEEKFKIPPTCLISKKEVAAHLARNPNKFNGALILLNKIINFETSIGQKFLLSIFNEFENKNRKSFYPIIKMVFEKFFFKAIHFSFQEINFLPTATTPGPEYKNYPCRIDSKKKGENFIIEVAEKFNIEKYRLKKTWLKENFKIQLVSLLFKNTCVEKNKNKNLIISFSLKGLPDRTLLDLIDNYVFSLYSLFYEVGENYCLKVKILKSVYYTRNSKIKSSNFFKSALHDYSKPNKEDKQKKQLKNKIVFKFFKIDSVEEKHCNPILSPHLTGGM